MEKRSLTFWEVVLAVFIGAALFEWAKGLKADSSFISELAPLFWIGVVLYIVGSVIYGQWENRRWNKEVDGNMLKTAREHGFESWAEYMVVHGTDDHVRKSYEKKAAEEKQKREKRAGQR